MSELNVIDVDKMADVRSLSGRFYRKSEVDNVIDEKDAEIARLRRALYKACANWADAEVFERTVGIDDLNVEANRWALMRNKCLKKAEEYK
jgi:hypothetical protein